jgi:DNA-binding beta-propeller fold protein YncE
MLLAILCLAPSALASAPVKEVLSSHFGWEVNKATKANVCLVGEECQLAQPGGEPGKLGSGKAGGFEHANDVAGAPNGDVYVADAGNNRVQEFTSSGEFVLMFGRGVDKTTGASVCTKSSGDTCGPGEPGTGAEALSPGGVAVDPNGERVYVLDSLHIDAARVDEYTASGELVLMIGKEVDQTTGANVCTKASGDTCGPGASVPPKSAEHDAFHFESSGDLLAVGSGGEHLLYVADAQRVQEINPAGEWRGEIALPEGANITSLALDPQSEVVYLVDRREPVIHEYTPAGGRLKTIEVQTRSSGQEIEVAAISVDPSGHLAVVFIENPGGKSPCLSGNGGTQFQAGMLYDAGSGRLLAEFATPPQLATGVVPECPRQIMHSVGFNGNGELFGAIAEAVVSELWHYTPATIGEALADPAACAEGPEHDTDVTFTCTLKGAIDPWGVPATKAWFQWGRTSAFGQETSPQAVKNATEPPVEGEEEPLAAVSAPIEGIRPNEPSLSYRVVATDRNVALPELLTSANASFTTPSVPPRIVSAPSATFVRPTASVLFGELNPENTSSEYFFEYGPPEALQACPGVRPAGCEGVVATAVQSSSLYGRMGATAEATGLHPATTYRFRLAAENEKHEAAAIGPADEGEFTTSAAPAVTAQTGAATVLGPTSALITGSINPDGQSSTYTFELGVYNGSATQYGVVLSAPAGAGTTPTPESLQLTGLQPGTTYAYRIAVHFGTGTTPGSSATGAAQTFTTEGLPTLLASPNALAMLPVPAVTFPAEPPPEHKSKPKPRKCRRGFKRGRHGRCVRARHARRAARRG